MIRKPSMKPGTKRLKRRAVGVADSYVAQVTDEEAQQVADAYKQAADETKNSVKSTLKVS
jgi:hypothetical protein